MFGHADVVEFALVDLLQETGHFTIVCWIFGLRFGKPASLSGLERRKEPLGLLRASTASYVFVPSPVPHRTRLPLASELVMLCFTS